MVGALTPVAIVLGGALAAACMFFSFSHNLMGPIQNFGSYYAREIDIADLKVKSEDLGGIVLTIAVLAWIALIIVFRPTFVVGAFFLPMILGLSVFAVKRYLLARVQTRTKQFRGQLEIVFRSLSSGVRVGLGLRQALLLVAEQSREPARKELTRVIGAANLGTDIFDALDEMGRRLPTTETQAFARIIRIQAQAGGDLAQVLEGLAATIRERRQLDRKIQGLTAQSRATAWLLGALPLCLLAFVLITQPAMRIATLTTGIGMTSLIVGLGLDAAAIVVLLKLTKFDA